MEILSLLVEVCKANRSLFQSTVTTMAALRLSLALLVATFVLAVQGQSKKAKGTDCDEKQTLMEDMISTKLIFFPDH